MFRWLLPRSRSIWLSLCLEVAFSARVDDKRVYIIGHPVDDDDGGVTSLCTCLLGWSPAALAVSRSVMWLQLTPLPGTTGVDHARLDSLAHSTDSTTRLWVRLD